VDLRELAQDLWQNHRGKLVGSLLGLVFAAFVMWVGFLWTVFVFICVIVGFWVGKRMDDHKENLVEVLDRILPPGNVE